MEDDEGRTALDIAIEVESKESIKLLSDYEKNPQPYLDKIKKVKDEAEKDLQAAYVGIYPNVDQQIQKLKRAFYEIQLPLSTMLEKSSTYSEQKGKSTSQHSEIQELKEELNDQKTEINALKKKQIEDKNENNKEILELVAHLGVV